jgi:hypothetical protein
VGNGGAERAFELGCWLGDGSRDCVCRFVLEERVVVFRSSEGARGCLLFILMGCFSWVKKLGALGVKSNGANGV